ncbi:MAG: polyamine aminopropyltransferase [Crenarchaeota archaeon]|nr:polyamine aminopropyltransferase [Thermoproteota archaeon]
MRDGLILSEPTSPNMASLFKIKGILAQARTPYQEVLLVDLEEFGRALVIDSLIQSTERDEFLYHEVLVHPAMVLHPNPKRVLIIGGGEGATLREVLKHKTVEKAVMVDIDEKVLEFAKEYLGFMHRGSFDDPRSEVVIMDGLKYVKNAAEKSFDVVILDLTDPYAGPAAKPLYSEEFYRDVYRILVDDGVMVTQAGNSFFYREAYEYVYNNVKKVFLHVAEYWNYVPSFAYTCNFVLASKKYDPYSLEPEKIDKILEERGVENKFLNGRVLKGLLLAGIVRG